MPRARPALIQTDTLRPSSRTGARSSGNGRSRAVGYRSRPGCSHPPTVPSGWREPTRVQGSYDGVPGGAGRVDEVEVADAGEFDETADLECLAHADRDAVIRGAVHEDHRDGGRGERGRVGDRVAVRDLVGCPAEQ